MRSPWKAVCAAASQRVGQIRCVRFGDGVARSPPNLLPARRRCGLAGYRDDPYFRLARRRGRCFLFDGVEGHDDRAIVARGVVAVPKVLPPRTRLAARALAE